MEILDFEHIYVTTKCVLIMSLVIKLTYVLPNK